MVRTVSGEPCTSWSRKLCDVIDRIRVEDPLEGRAVEVDREVAEHAHHRRRLVADATVAPDDHHGVAAVPHQLLEASLAALLVQLLGLHQGVEGEGDLGAEDGEALVDLLGHLLRRRHRQTGPGADAARDRDDHDVVAAVVDEAHRPIADRVDLLEGIVDAGVHAVHLAVRAEQLGRVDRATVVHRDPRHVAELDAEQVTGRLERDLTDRRRIARRTEGTGGVPHRHLAPGLGLARAHDQLQADGHQHQQHRREAAEHQTVDGFTAQVQDDRAQRRRRGAPGSAA